MARAAKKAIETGATKPDALAVEVANIPAELQALPQWIVWNYERKEQRWTKPPRQASSGNLASTTDPATWATLLGARAAMLARSLSGIGFVFTAGDGLAGIDLDDCRDPNTGVIEQWALDIIGRINSYTEVSPSGTGVKIICRAKLVAGKRFDAFGVEIYDRERYFTITGIVVGEFTAIESRQAEVDGLVAELEQRKAEKACPQVVGTGRHKLIDSDEELRERALRARNGAKFKELWEGGLCGCPSRSEADLAFCNMLRWWCGPDPDRIDRLFRASARMRTKWERDDYRQRTIGKALEVADYYDPHHNGAANGKPYAAETGDTGLNATRDGVPITPTLNGSLRCLKNYREVEVEEDGKKKTFRRGLPIEAIHRDLVTLTGGWPKRLGDLMFAPGADGRPTYLETDQEVFAWINGRLGGSQAAVRWSRGDDRITQGQFTAYLAQRLDSYTAVEEYPHWPELPGHYYMHPEPVGGSKRVLQLLNRFKPATAADRDLILAFLLTQIWGGLPGRRPAFLFTTDEDDDPHKGRGAGKTTVAKVAGWLFGGMVQASANDDIDKLKTRLLTPSALGVRLVLIDNIKSFKLSWAELESLITSSFVSGHRMYHGEATRPNTITYALTINGASLSRDLAQRVVPVHLKRPEYSGEWEEETYALVSDHRWEIIGDMLEILREPADKLGKFSRWGSWEADVLAHVADPQECQRVIAERQETYDEDQAEADVVAHAFREQLQQRGLDPETCSVLIPSAVAAAWVNDATNEKGRPTNKTSAYLASLAIPELRRSNRSEFRGWKWTGINVSQGVTPKILPKFV